MDSFSFISGTVVGFVTGIVIELGGWYFYKHFYTKEEVVEKEGEEVVEKEEEEVVEKKLIDRKNILRWGLKNVKEQNDYFVNSNTNKITSDNKTEKMLFEIPNFGSNTLPLKGSGTYYESFPMNYGSKMKEQVENMRFKHTLNNNNKQIVNNNKITIK